MPPGRSAQMHGVVVRHSGKQTAIVRQLIPLLASDFARFASDAQGRVSEKAFFAGHVYTFPSFVSIALKPCLVSGLCRAHGRSRSSARDGNFFTNGPLVTCRRPLLLRPDSIIAVRAFDSWIDTFGSPTNAIKSFAASPRTSPFVD